MKKRIPSAIICVLLIAALCGCNSPRENDMSDYPLSNIAEISFVNVDDGNITVLHTLESEQIAAFLEDFAQLRCFYYWNDPLQGLYGNNIQITLLDGSYYMISLECTGYYSGGKVQYGRKYYDGDEFDALWFSYTGLERGR